MVAFFPSVFPAVIIVVVVVYVRLLSFAIIFAVVPAGEIVVSPLSGVLSWCARLAVVRVPFGLPLGAFIASLRVLALGAIVSEVMEFFLLR